MTTDDARRDMAAGYGSSPSREELRLRQRAAMYRPEDDAQAARIRETYAQLGTPIPARLQLVIGLHETAKAAAEALNNNKEQQ
ncbi:MAG: hypothetical protein H0U51_00815 [Propionibacteriales bacterium]|nr:hypothetical protein [Propionibacteriales bacterium]